MTATVESVRAKDLLARLQRHYIKPGPMPGGIFLAEVGLNGPVQQRRVDAVHVGFTSSSGRILTGHEIKVSRSDWLHELDQSDKADRWADQCHAWYVVAPSVEIVKPEEVPHGWGLMVPNPRTTTRMDKPVKAEVRPDLVPSWLIVRSIMARYDTLRAVAIEQSRHKHEDELRRKIAEVRQDLAARGVDTGDGTAQRIGQIIRRVRDETRGDLYITSTDDEVVSAIVDQMRARAAAEQLRMDVRRLVGTVQDVTAPFAHVYGELAKIAAECDELRAELAGVPLLLASSDSAGAS